jgi:signal transduction histidine kinase
VNEAACASLKYTREEMLALAMFDIDPNFPAKSWDDYWAKIKRQGFFAFSSTHYRKDDTSFPVDITINFLEFEGIEYNYMIARDVTERKLAENELKEQKKVVEKARAVAEKARAELAVTNEMLEKAVQKGSWMVAEAGVATMATNKFLTDISRECRSLVDGVQDKMNKMLKFGLSNKRRDLSEVNYSCNSLQWLIDNMQNLSMVGIGKAPVETEAEFNLVDLLAGVTQTFSERAKVKGLKFSYTKKAGVPDILRGAPATLEYILTNLLGNAVEFTNKGDVGLQVEADQLKDHEVRLQFSAWDFSGSVSKREIEDDYRNLIQAGSQVDGEYSGDLALAVAKRLVVSMGGEMWHKSDSKRGTAIQFRITFRQP